MIAMFNKTVIRFEARLLWLHVSSFFLGWRDLPRNYFKSDNTSGKLQRAREVTQARIVEIAWQRSFLPEPQFFLSTIAITLVESIFAVSYFISLCIAHVHGCRALAACRKRRKKNEFGESRSNDPRTIVSQCDSLAYSIGNSYFRESLTILSISKSGKFHANK